jgi:hypothetical protein
MFRLGVIGTSRRVSSRGRTHSISRAHKLSDIESDLSLVERSVFCHGDGVLGVNRPKWLEGEKV